MPKRSDKHPGTDSLLCVVCTTKTGRKTSTYTITVGTSVVALALILIGSHLPNFQSIMRLVGRLTH